jgi:UDP-N-acetylglucosamine acyltransferase
MSLHPTAIIDPTAVLGADVEVGPYAVIGAQVTLGAGCRVDHHSSLVGPMTAGEGNHFFPFCSLGQKTQDLKYTGEPTFLEIGDRNVFREFVTVNRGTAPGEKTIIGNDNLFLSYVHIAHNCEVGHHTIFSNNGTLAGHVIVEDHAIIGGLTAVHQFCRIGAHAMLGGCTKIVQDVTPFTVVDGNPGIPRAINAVGLKRRGFSEATIKALQLAYRVLYSDNLNTSQAVEKIQAEFGTFPEVQQLLQFVTSSKRGITKG